MPQRNKLSIDCTGSEMDYDPLGENHGECGLRTAPVFDQEENMDLSRISERTFKHRSLTTVAAVFNRPSILFAESTSPDEDWENED
jgi:hypothetical protein